MHEELIARLRERRMLATDGLMTGAGRSHAKLVWVTGEPDPDCAAAANALEAMQAALASLRLTQFGAVAELALRDVERS